MYRIVYIHKDSAVENTLYIPGDNEYSLIKADLNIGIGQSGEMTISIQSNNPARSDIICLTDEFVVYRKGNEIFRGRAVTVQEDFDLTGTMVIEGVLSYFYDTFYPPFDFHGKPGELLLSLLENHNGHVESRKQILLGNVTVTDKNDYIYRASEDYLRTLSILSDKFNRTSLGGYFRIRTVSGTKYLDYLQSYATTAEQEVVFGSNILNIAQTIEYGDLITALIPLGKKDDSTGEYITVKSVNGGKDYIQDNDLVNQYGFIVDCVKWEDVEEPANLLTKGRQYLAQASVALKSISIRAVDLALADPEIPSLNIGDAVHVISRPHDIDQWIELAELKLDLVDPRNDTLTFGAVSTSFTKNSGSASRQIAESVSDLTVNFHKVAADYITAEYLSANYVAAQNLEAEVAKLGYATISDLAVTNANIANLQAIKANVADLNASNANITNLQSAYGNIRTLLAGNAGVGDLQNIHLTSLNSVIDEAVIKNLVSTYITANDLVAGTIDTSKFRITNPDGTIVIEDGTQTFSDANGNVRIQIGEDALGNFTFILYGATGQGILLDETGIKESGIADGLIKDAKIASDANISASKLDIASLFEEINDDGSHVIYGNKIYLDESSQTLVQAYSQITSNIESVDDKADSAIGIAQTASANADAAIAAIAGISSLDNVTAVLSNDSHVVHTNYDGSGGVYTYASTTVSAYKGDADISSSVTITYTASSGVAGTWTAATRTYQVTGLTADNGYVDFVVTYTPQSGTPVTVTKRFSISKAPDGRAGSAYNLQASVGVMQKAQNGTFKPATVTFSATEAIGSTVSPYSGKFRIEESEDGATYVQKYITSATESSKVYTPTGTANYIRATLLDSSSVMLDAQTVTVIPDAGEIADGLSEAQESIMSISTRVGTVETGINGLSVDLQQAQQDIIGISDNTILYQAISDYSSSDQVTINAKVWKNGEDAHEEYPAAWFSWHKKTEHGLKTIGLGYSIQVNRSDFEYNGTVVGRFTTFDEGLLVLPTGEYITMPNSNRIKTYYQ